MTAKFSPDSATPRRQFLQTVSVGAFALSLGASRSARAADAGRYADLKTSDYLGEPRIAATVEGAKVFTEGPAADAHGHLYFSNTTPNHILRYDADTGKLNLFRENSNGANGNYFDPQGRLWTCEGGMQDAGRVTRTDLGTGKITVVCDHYQGKPLGAPNDLALDAKGRLYFTSRLTNTSPAAGNVNSVYRVDPDGSVARILAAPDIDMPNGIVTSPDDKLLYLVESDGRENRSRCIRAYDLNADGSVSHGRILINFYPGRSGDGMCVDAEGNLYIAAGLHKTRGSSETLDTLPGIHVVTPAGKLVAFVRTPEDTITNCTFGGPGLRTLYVTCGKYLLSIPSRIPGKPAYLPKA